MKHQEHLQRMGASRPFMAVVGDKVVSQPFTTVAHDEVPGTSDFRDRKLEGRGEGLLETPKLFSQFENLRDNGRGMVTVSPPTPARATRERLVEGNSSTSKNSKKDENCRKYAWHFESVILYPKIFSKIFQGSVNWQSANKKQKKMFNVHSCHRERVGSCEHPQRESVNSNARKRIKFSYRDRKHKKKQTKKKNNS